MSTCDLMHRVVEERASRLDLTTYVPSSNRPTNTHTYLNKHKPTQGIGNGFVEVAGLSLLMSYSKDLKRDVGWMEGASSMGFLVRARVRVCVMYVYVWAYVNIWVSPLYMYGDDRGSIMDGMVTTNLSPPSPDHDRPKQRPINAYTRSFPSLPNTKHHPQTDRPHAGGLSLLQFGLSDALPYYVPPQR